MFLLCLVIYVLGFIGCPLGRGYIIDMCACTFKWSIYSARSSRQSELVFVNMFFVKSVGVGVYVNESKKRAKRSRKKSKNTSL